MTGLAVPLLSGAEANRVARHWATEANESFPPSFCESDAPAERTGFIYFAVARTGVLKIGHSVVPNARIRGLRNQCPYGEFSPVVYVVNQDHCIERALHLSLVRRFGLSREYYKKGTKLVALARDFAAAASAAFVERFVPMTRRGGRPY